MNTAARVVVPTVRGRNISLIAAMNIEGMVYHEVIQQTNVNASIFCEFLIKLFEELAKNEIGNAWLILDNASIHKTQQVRDLVAEKGFHLMFLPPYSPMVNPIEEVFSKIKFYARNVLADPTNSIHLKDIINQSVETITAANCNNFYTHMYMQLPAAAAGEPL